ncbi:MAG: MlaD family protein [Acidobacteriota bacterium]|jgi:phospholipid/cholesterol/gamma-HCH transport system substrate-binding protein
MAFVALAILFVLVFLLTGNKSLFSKELMVYTLLDDSAAITEGSAVRLNGILIGKISKVGLSGENSPNRIIRLELAIDEDKIGSIPADSIAAVGAENLLGTKYINIKKGKSATPIKAGGELKSLDTREFQDLVNAAYPSLQSLQKIVERVDNIVGMVEKGQGSIGKLLSDDELYRRLVSTVAEVQSITANLGSGRGTIGKLLNDDAIYEDLRTTLKKTDAVIEDLQAGKGSAGKLLKDPALYDETKQTIAEMRKTIDGINRGEGTAGKLMKDEALYKNLNQLVVRLDAVVERLQSGQGTMGQLMVNPQLYESMNGTMKEMNSFMKDFRANPKKFLTIQLKLF